MITIVILSVTAIIFALTDAYMFLQFRKAVEAIRRENKAEIKDLLDRLMYAQGRPWVMPPRDATPIVAEEEETIDPNWKEL